MWWLPSVYKYRLLEVLYIDSRAALPLFPIILYLKCSNGISLNHHAAMSLTSESPSR